MTRYRRLQCRLVPSCRVVPCSNFFVFKKKNLHWFQTEFYFSAFFFKFFHFIYLLFILNSKVVTLFPRVVKSFQFPLHLFTSKHTFSHISYTSLHYSLHPYTLPPSYTYLYPLLTTLTTQKTHLQHQIRISLNLSLLLHLLHSLFHSNQTFSFSFPTTPIRISTFHFSIFFTSFLYFLLLFSTYSFILLTWFKKNGKNKRINI